MAFFFFLPLHNFSSLDGKQMSISHCIGITSLMAKVKNKGKK